MNLELIFSVCTGMALVGWILLVFFPKKVFTQKVVFAGIPSLLIAVIYTFLLIYYMDAGEGGSFFTLEGVKILFANENVLLIGWIHYLAFDLWVGCWEVKNAQKHGLPHALVVICLFFTCMYGPAGLLLYVVSRNIYLKRWASNWEL